MYWWKKAGSDHVRAVSEVIVFSQKFLTHIPTDYDLNLLKRNRSELPVNQVLWCLCVRNCEMSKDMNNYVRVSCNNTVESVPECLTILVWSILERQKKEDIGRGRTSYGRRTDGRAVDSPLTREQSIAEWFSTKLKECPDYIFWAELNFKRSWTK